MQSLMKTRQRGINPDLGRERKKDGGVRKCSLKESQLRSEMKVSGGLKVRCETFT